MLFSWGQVGQTFMTKLDLFPLSCIEKNSYLEAFHFDDFLDTIYNEHLLIFIDESNVACV